MLGNLRPNTGCTPCPFGNKRDAMFTKAGNHIPIKSYTQGRQASSRPRKSVAVIIIENVEKKKKKKKKRWDKFGRWENGKPEPFKKEGKRAGGKKKKGNTREPRTKSRGGGGCPLRGRGSDRKSVMYDERASAEWDPSPKMNMP